MVEFLSDFVIQLLQSDLCELLGEAKDELRDNDSILQGKNEDKIMKYLGDK
jgi:hypothetical protein